MFRCTFIFFSESNIEEMDDLSVLSDGKDTNSLSGSDNMNDSDGQDTNVSNSKDIDSDASSILKDDDVDPIVSVNDDKVGGGNFGDQRTDSCDDEIDCVSDTDINPGDFSVIAEFDLSSTQLSPIQSTPVQAITSTPISKSNLPTLQSGNFYYFNFVPLQFTRTRYFHIHTKHGFIYIYTTLKNGFQIFFFGISPQYRRSNVQLCRDI